MYNACFYDVEVNLPVQPEEYLGNLYGKSFMQAPPIEKRYIL